MGEPEKPPVAANAAGVGSPPGSTDPTTNAISGRNTEKVADKKAPADFLILDDLEIEKLKPPEWLVEPILTEHGFVVLYGPPESGKSFVALSLALSICTGSPWFGREVSKGSVLYIAGEGAFGLGARIRAWKCDEGFSGLAGCFFVPSAIQFANTEKIILLIGELEQREIRPRLIVIDTLARCFVGKDENSARDVGEFIYVCDQMRHITHAAILVVHHTIKGGGWERGSSALRGAADTMISCNKMPKAEASVLICDKQKDAEPFADITFQLKKVGLDGGVTSCVPCEVDLLDVVMEGPSDQELKVIEALKTVGDDGATATDWLKAAEAAGVSERTFYRIKKDLEAHGRVKKEGTRKGARFRIAT